MSYHFMDFKLSNGKNGVTKLQPSIDWTFYKLQTQYKRLKLCFLFPANTFELQCAIQSPSSRNWSTYQCTGCALQWPCPHFHSLLSKIISHLIDWWNENAALKRWRTNGPHKHENKFQYGCPSGKCKWSVHWDSVSLPL